jgi:lipopolysaccharide biosynthesis protein
MSSAIFSRAYRALRLVVPTWGERRYRHLMRRHQLFDRQFYRTSNPGLHWLARLRPEMHYIQRGEPAGLCPNAAFSPRAYLHHNPDLPRGLARPFLHYLQFGHREDRITTELPGTALCPDIAPPVLRQSDHAPQAPVAVVVHLYYPALWPEIAKVLHQQQFHFDLFVSLVKQEGAEDLTDQITRNFSGAKVYDMPNHGRDIFPFLHLINAGLLDPYRAVCKIHTKKSPHRADGDQWREHLIEGVLGAPHQTRIRLNHFLKTPDCALWVADGQIYSGAEWWGSNLTRCRELLHRVDIPCDPSALRFPAGSMYWLKPVMIDMLRGLGLEAGDFEPEQAQVDGTTAHAIERVIGHLPATAKQRMLQSSELDAPPPATARHRPGFISAFYLPQFHPTPENDRWWGAGFTEWRGVVAARPQYDGHAHPALPGALGFYDLRLPEVMAQQSQLARRAGVNAFCVYHYWFGGTRMLEQPMETLLARTEVDFPFYLCWANESWRRNWDGLSGETLIEQSYASGFAAKLARDVARFMRDPRYARPDGYRLRFVIYRPEDLPDPGAAIAEMRAVWHELGLGEVEIGAVRFHLSGPHPLAEDLVDFWIEMPPHGLVTPEDYLLGGPAGNRLDPSVDPAFRGLIYDYAAVAARAVSPAYLHQLPRNTIAGIMPSWDNTARRGHQAHIAYGATPARFSAWLDTLVQQRLASSYQQEIMINAWNEWAEKAMLEPSARYGAANLRVLERLCHPLTEEV